MSLQVSPFGIATVITAILIGVGIVQQNVILLAAITGIALAIVLPVEMSLGLFALLIPFDQVLVLGNSGTTLTWVAGAFAGGALVLYGFASGRFKSPTRAALYWGVFVLWTAASTVWAIDPAISLKWIPTIAALFALYIVAASFQIRSRELWRTCLLAVTGGAATALLVIFQFARHVTFVGSTGQPEGRASLIAGNLESDPNFLSFSLLLPLSLALGGALSRENLLKRAVLLAALVLMAVSMFLTMSRGGLIALLATVLVYLLRTGIRRRTLIPVLVLAISLFFLPDLFYNRLAQAATDRGTGRYDVWLAGLEIVKRHPVIGTGSANFGIAYRNVAGYAHVFLRGPNAYTRNAHNIYLHICAETGVIGLGLFIAAIWSQMKAAYRALPSRSSPDYFRIAIEAACWGQLVAGLSGDIQWTKPFWFAFILLAMATQTRGESELNGPPCLVDSPA